MYNFSSDSLAQLKTCHPDLQTLFNEVIKYRDCLVIQGFRNEEDQNKAFQEGKTKLQWPNGKHNSVPSHAIDVTPYPIDWNYLPAFYNFSGFVLGISEYLFKEGQIAHRIRWGGDWNMNQDLKNNKFNDLVHFEIL